MNLFFFTIAAFYLMGAFAFGLSAFFSYISEITKEPRYHSAYETFEYAKAVMFSFWVWPFVWWKMGEARRAGREGASTNKP